MKRFLSMILLGILTLTPLAPAEAAVEIGLSTSGITLPSRLDPTDCSFTTVTVQRSDKKAFADLNVFGIETSVEEGPVSPNLAKQITNERGRLTLYGIYSPHTAVNIAVQLCTKDLPSFEPKYMWAFVTLSGSEGTKIAAAKVKIPILTPTGVTDTSKKFISTCQINPELAGFSTNFAIEVTKLQLIYDYYTERLIGASVDLRGTLIRKGLLADKEKISLVPSGKTKSIASTTTDSKGQFKFSFKFASTGITSTSDSLGIRVESKTLEIGDQRITVPVASDWIRFNWLLSPGISSLPSSNWTPSFSPECLDAYTNFINNKDDKNRGRHVLYSAAFKLWGTLNSQSSNDSRNTTKTPVYPNQNGIFMESVASSKTYTKSSSGSSGGSVGYVGGSGSGSSSGSSGGSLGKCWVNGYVTKTGKRVSGYYRRC